MSNAGRASTTLKTAALFMVAASNATPATAGPAPATPTAKITPPRKLFLDVHELGKGKVTARDVADAHRKDLATQGKHGVDFKAYWVDEKEGKIYCLVEAPSAEAATAVHREAHGLLADHLFEVVEGA